MTTKSAVLVIGGGLAGLMAALAASSQGKTVTIVSKGPVGRAGNTLVSGGGISAATGEAGNDAAVYLNDILRSGKMLNNYRLTKKLAEESPEMLEKLAGFGVKLVQNNGIFKKRRPPGHSVPRNIPTDWTGLSYQNRGLSFMLPLLERVQEKNVSLVSGVKICRLLKCDNRVIGAAGIDRDGNLRGFYADGVVLATGGGGYLYSKTNNTSDITGDGLAMALDVGCRLQDMEQVQFYPTMMFEPVKAPISNPLFGAGAVLRNAGGERFMARYDPDGDMATRDNMARAIFLEIQAGRGIDGCVHMDCTGIPADQLKVLYQDFYRFLLAAKLDPTKDYLKVSPCVHYFLGGIVIDDTAATNVPGLYAAGEICGGVHGANRLSGAALMEACVFGWQAGISAASQRGCPSGHQQSLPQEGYHIRATGGNDAAIFKTLRSMMWENVSLIRSASSLQRMNGFIEQTLRQLEAEPDNAGRSAVRSALETAKAVVLSALLREESRGAHFRSDFPDMNAAFDGNVYCRKEGECLKAELVKDSPEQSLI